ncbi:MAG: hypothetical protein U9R60_18760 [Bacteroidota bacterium]|nr:hypothetical protein [Bacteroidota bacterium]
MPIGKSGVLKGRKATTYDLLEGLRRKQLADLDLNIKLVLEADDICTGCTHLLPEVKNSSNDNKSFYYISFCL